MRSQIIVFGTTISITLLASSPSRATTITGIVAEGVTDYSYDNGGSHSGDIDCNSQVTNFYNPMTAAGTGWTTLKFYQNNLVYDTDFRDHEKSGFAGDDDNLNFDPPGAAIAVFCGHGTCDDATSTACTTSANCPAGQVCMANPPTTSASACAQNTPRRLITSSTGSRHGNVVLYGDGNSAFGEIATWAGAGTNGGDNIVFIWNSCGIRLPWQYSQTAAMFAGMSQLDMIMPQSNVTGAGTADAVVNSQRGSLLASYALANPNSSIVSGWGADLDSSPQNIGASCPDQTGTYTYGGGHGIAGCGAHATLASDVNQGFADWKVRSMTWMYARNANLKPSGTGYFSGWFHCNYDCNTYGFTK